MFYLIHYLYLFIGEILDCLYVLVHLNIFSKHLFSLYFFIISTCLVLIIHSLTLIKFLHFFKLHKCFNYFPNQLLNLLFIRFIITKFTFFKLLNLFSVTKVSVIPLQSFYHLLSFQVFRHQFINLIIFPNFRFIILILNFAVKSDFNSSYSNSQIPLLIFPIF